MKHEWEWLSYSWAYCVNCLRRVDFMDMTDDVREEACTGECEERYYKEVSLKER